MIDRPTGLVLPLMNHFVQQRLDSLIPPVPPNMPPADHDLGRMPHLSPQRIVTESRLHPA
jgi:hypothetical protein